MEFQNPFSKLPSWVAHVLLWLGIWLVMSFLMSEVEPTAIVFQRVTLLVLGQIIIVYWNIYYLIPRFFFQKQYGWYFLGAVASIALVIYGFGLIDEFFGINPFERNPEFKPWRRRPHNLKNWKLLRSMGRSIPLTMALIISTIYKTVELANQKEKEAAQLKNEKLDAEMKFLRSQINPHFLFNTLNNVYALSVIGSEQTSENLLKISKMLRYMLYEANANFLPLHKELNYLKNYIDLQRLKDSAPLNIGLELDESRPDLPIPPMILIPFVENSFKHSKIEDTENGWIKIKLQHTDKVLHFQISNSLPKAEYTKDKVGGIGLKNVKQRLDLIYPGKHELKITRKEEEYQVDLKIDHG